MTQTRHRLDPEDVPPFLQVADPLWRPLSASASRTHGQLALGVEITRDPQDQTSQLEQEPNREGRHYSCRISGGRCVVLVDEAAKPVATVDLASR